MNNNQLTVLFDYRHEGRTPAHLEDWLRDNRSKLNDMRLFYVIKANMQSEITKFGIAGLDGGTSGYGRLHQYVIMYGENSSNNKCTGVKLFYLAGTKYNPLVQTSNSLVFKKELFLKRELKNLSQTDSLRGTERTTMPVSNLIRLIDRSSNKTSSEQEQELRRSQRIKASEIDFTSDKIIEILDSNSKGKGKTKYLTKWSRPYVTDKGPVYNTWESLETIKKVKNAQSAVDLYKSQNPKKVYRD